MIALSEKATLPAPPLRAIGLFAGIGGIELGLRASHIEATDLVEIDGAARRVLAKRFPGATLHGDIRDVRELPATDLVAAGFPCQDLSQAGRKGGIHGTNSSLVTEVFRVCRAMPSPPEWLLLENVSYMLKLDSGRAMDLVTRNLESMGYAWAYRVVDARSFGIPQRRQRVIICASRSQDPRGVLFADEGEIPYGIDLIGPVNAASAYGFYWTEGLRGLGWTHDAVPTIKGGSRIGIPSPPAVWKPGTGAFGTPSLSDVERLQGFPKGWTNPAIQAGQKDPRWQLLGNAVCVPMAEWVGRRLLSPTLRDTLTTPLVGGRWPVAAWGFGGRRWAVDSSMWPFGLSHEPLDSFLADSLKPLSHRAARGFLARAKAGRLRFADGFLESLAVYAAA